MRNGGATALETAPRRFVEESPNPPPHRAIDRV
jgi:hypothetical protein